MGSGPRAPKDGMRPRRWIGASGAALSLTIRSHECRRAARNPAETRVGKHALIESLALLVYRSAHVADDGTLERYTLRTSLGQEHRARLAAEGYLASAGVGTSACLYIPLGIHRRSRTSW